MNCWLYRLTLFLRFHKVHSNKAVSINFHFGIIFSLFPLLPSFLHAGHCECVRIFITFKSLLSAMWPVSNTTNILNCLQLRHNAKQESYLSGPHRNIITSLYPAVDCQSLQCSLSVHDCTSVGTVITVIPTTVQAWWACL